MAGNHKDNIIKLIQRLSYRYATWQVFSDFLEMSALAVSNSVDWRQQDEREKQYLDVISRYEKKEQEIFPELFGELVLALEDKVNGDGPGDVLGEVFHSLELHNKWKGQFFTPDHICEMMGQMALGERDPKFGGRGYLTVSEPCAGSGAMVLGFAKAMKQRGFNYCSQMVVTAVDVDIKCVHMTYLQLSLYGIPAVVIHGDTILVKEWSQWYTPVYILDAWRARKAAGRVTAADEKEIPNEAPEVPQQPVSQPIILPGRTKKRTKPEQLSLIDLSDFRTEKKENVG